MDRFGWCDGLLAPDEQLVAQHSGVRVYDGEDKTAFDQGKLILTTHRFIWRDHKDQRCVMDLTLDSIARCEEQAATFTKSAKIVLHLHAAPAGGAAGGGRTGPVTVSRYTYIRFSFLEGGRDVMLDRLQECLRKRTWETKSLGLPPRPVAGGAKRAGIVGIERKMQQKHKETDSHISQAFTDLKQLMDRAKDMVTLSKTISTKIKDRQGDITEDETVRFKSYLLSLGISDPVTRDQHSSADKYHRELAKEISRILETPLKESGGIMTLTDVYCRVNRARGMELLSPEDLVKACSVMNGLPLSVRYHVFESGVMVLQLQSHSETEVVKQTEKTVTSEGSLTADELAKLIGLSVILAKERLLSTERAGRVCRDESVQGLRFYPNLFLSPPQST